MTAPLYSGSNPYLCEFLWQSGVSYLDREITINGITKSPTFWYNGVDAGAATWTAEYGSDLSITGAGDAPTLNYGSPFLDGTDGVKIEGGKYYSVADYDITTQDFIDEYVVLMPTTGLLYHYIRVDANDGFAVYSDSTTLRVLFRDGGSQVLTSVSISENSVYHIFIVVDRSNIARIYVNGEANDSASIAGLASLSQGTSASFNFPSGGADGAMLQAARWDFGSGGLDTHAQDDLVTERYATVQGAIAANTTQGTKYYSYFDRASGAMLEKYNTSDSALELWAYGDDSPRIVSVKDSNSNVIEGIRCAPQQTYYDAYSEDLDSWTKTDCTVSSQVAGQPSPIKGVNFDGIVLNNTETIGKLDRYIINPDGSSTYLAGAFLKKGSEDWVRLSFYQGGGGTQAVTFFDLNNGVVGGIANADHYDIVDCGNDVYFCWIAHALSATNNTTFQFYVAEGNGDVVLSTPGDGSTVQTYVTGVRAFQGSFCRPSDYIKTTSSDVTVEADEIYYDASQWVDNTNQQGMLRFSFWCPDYTPTAEQDLVTLNYNGGTTDYIKISMDTNGKIKASMRSGSGIVDTLTLTENARNDDVIHSCSLQWSTTRMTLVVDDEYDTYGLPTVPTNIDRLYYNAWVGVVGRM